MNQENKITKLIAIYGRVSTGRQEEEETIKNQLMITRELAKKNGYVIVKEYIDEGWSGDMLARPALDELRADAKNKNWEAVLVYDPDRIARRYSYQELVMDELKELGMEIIFVTIPAPKNDEEKILYGVRGLFAQYERVKIAERFRLGKLRKAREGHLVISEAPYGYTYIPRKDKQHGYLEINKQESEVVKMLFSWLAYDGLTMRMIVKKLQELNIKPRKSKKGVWSTSTLTTLLRNKTYIGEAHYLRTCAIIPENPFKKEKYRKLKKTSRKIRPEEEWIKISVPAIIEKELFEKAQAQLRINFERCKRNKKNQYLLSGKIYCTCGAKRIGEGQQHGKHLYYRCCDKVLKFPLVTECKEKGINARLADKLIWEKIVSLMSSPELLMAQVKKFLNKQIIKVEKSDISISELEKEIGKLKKEEDRYLKAYGAELISLEKLKEYTRGLKGKILELESQISYIRSAENQSQGMNLANENEIKRFCDKAKEMLNDLNFETKQSIILNVVDKIIGNKTELQVKGYLPVNINNYNYVGYKTKHRNSGITECRQVNAV